MVHRPLLCNGIPWLRKYTIFRSHQNIHKEMFISSMNHGFLTPCVGNYQIFWTTLNNSCKRRRTQVVSLSRQQKGDLFFLLPYLNNAWITSLSWIYSEGEQTEYWQDFQIKCWKTRSRIGLDGFEDSSNLVVWWLIFLKKKTWRSVAPPTNSDGRILAAVVKKRSSPTLNIEALRSLVYCCMRQSQSGSSSFSECTPALRFHNSLGCFFL